MFASAASMAPAGPDSCSTESSSNSLAADVISTQNAFSQMWPLTDGSHPFADWEALPAVHSNPVCRPPIVTAEPTGESDSATLSRFSSSQSEGGLVQVGGGRQDVDSSIKVQPHGLMSLPEKFQHDQSFFNPSTGQPYMHMSNTGSDDLSSETIMLKDVDCPDQYGKSLNSAYPTAGQSQQSYLRRANTEPEPSWTPANLAATLAALRKAGASNTLPSKHHDEPTPDGAPSVQRSMSMFHQQVAALPYPVSNALTQQIAYNTGPGMKSLLAPVVPIQEQRPGSCNSSLFEDAANNAARFLPQPRGPTPPLPEGMAAAGGSGNAQAQLQPDEGGMGGKYMSGTNLVAQGASPFATASGSSSGNATASVLQQQMQMQQQQAMLQQHAMAQHQQHAVMQQQQHHALSQQQLLQQHNLIQQQQQEHQRLVQQQEQHSNAMHHHHQLQGTLPALGAGLHMSSLGGGSTGGIPSISPLHLRAAAVERAPWVAGFAPVVNKFDNPACNTLFIGNLGDSVDEGELSLLLSLQPGFKQIKLVRNPRQVSCFVEFTSVEDAVAVHAALQGVLLHSSDRGPIRIQFSKNPFGQRCPPSLAGPGPMGIGSAGMGMGMRSFFQDTSLHSQSTSRQHSESNSSWAATSGAHSTTSNQWDQLLGAGSASLDAWQLDVGGPAGGYLLPSGGSNGSQQQMRVQNNRTPPPSMSSVMQQHGAGAGAPYGSYNSARDYSSVPREGMEPLGMRRVGSLSEGQLYGKATQGGQSQGAFADFMPWPPSAGPIMQQREASPLPSHLGWSGQQQQGRPAPGAGGGGMLTEQHQQMLLLQQQQQHTAHQQQLGRSAMSALLQHGPAATAMSSQALLSALSWGQASGWMSGNPDIPR